MRGFAKTICLALFILMLSMQAAQGQGTKFISGRVVDAAQRPVANALVTLQPLRSPITETTESVDGLIAEYKTDSNGRFRIAVSFSSQQKARLYVTMPVPPNAYAPLTAPFLNLTGARLFAVQTVAINETGDTNVGDVPVNVRYSTAVIHLQDSSGLPLLKRKNGPPPIRLRVRDARSDIVSEDNVPSQAIRENDSSVVIALPEGIWSLELALDSKDTLWHAVNRPLSIRGSSSDLQLTLKMANNESQLQCSNDKAGCERHPETARRELEQLGIEFSPDSFVKRAAKGNQLAVLLFLSAGMSVDSKDKHGTPLLVAAADYPEIIKCLLAAGASVNLRNVDGDTALIHAAINGNTESALVLIAQGAELNAKTKDGTTALMLAAGNGHIEVVRTLFTAGADPNVRNNEGLTALDYALRSSNEDVIRLLTQTGARKQF